MIKATLKQPMKISTTSKSTVMVDRNVVLNKQVSILTSSRIYRPLTTSSYISVDIPQVPLILSDSEMEEYIIAFENPENLRFIKDYMQHPYELDTIRVRDIAYYLDKSRCNLMTLVGCLGESGSYPCSKHQYTALTLSHTNIHDEIIPLTSLNFMFMPN